MIRDVLIGATPAAAIADWRYFATALTATAVVLSLNARRVSESKLKEKVRDVGGRAVRYDRVALVADAFTLGLFAVAGTLKAQNYHLPVFSAALLGTVTATGGGVVRDVLVNEVPLVLQRELYAIPAFAGGLFFALATKEGGLEPAFGLSMVAALFTAAIRLVSLWRDWHAPRPGHVD